MDPNNDHLFWGAMNSKYLFTKSKNGDELETNMDFGINDVIISQFTNSFRKIPKDLDVAHYPGYNIITIICEVPPFEAQRKRIRQIEGSLKK